MLNVFCENTSRIWPSYNYILYIGDSTGFNVEASKENDNGCGEACREGKEEEEKKEVEHIVYLYLQQYWIFTEQHD